MRMPFGRVVAPDDKGAAEALAGGDVTVTLGSTAASGYLKTDTARNTPVWTPGSGVVDEYGNATSTAAVYGTYERLF